MRCIPTGVTRYRSKGLPSVPASEILFDTMTASLPNTLSITQQEEQNHAVTPDPEKRPLLLYVDKLRHPSTFSKSSENGSYPTTTSPDAPDTELYGYLMMAVSCFGYAIMSLLFHIAETTYSFPPVSAVFVRSLVLIGFSSLYIIKNLDVSETLTSLSTRQRSLVALRGLMGGFAVLTSVLSLKYLPVGEATSIFFINPVITLVISHIVLSEPLTFLDCIATAASLVGILLVSYPDGESQSETSARERIIGSALGIACAFLSSVAYVVIRSLGKSIHYMVNVLSLGVAILLISVSMGGYVGPQAIMSNKWGSLLIFIGSVTAFIAVAFLTVGLQNCNAGRGLLIRNLDVPLTYMLGMLFLAEIPTALRLLGSAMVLSSAVMVGMREMMQTSR